MEYREKRESVREYFKEKEFVMIEMNDKTTNKALERSVLSYLKGQIEDCLTVDASFMTLNRAEHINLMLEYDLTLEEIRLAQALSIYDSIEKKLEDKKNTEEKDLLLDVSYSVLKRMAKSKEIDKYIGISDLIKIIKTPLIIHSTGSSDLTRILGTNPYKIDRDFSARQTSSDYKEALKRARDPKTIKIVMDDIEKNFENILALNQNSIIVSLGLCVPDAFKKRKYRSFKELIVMYNQALKELCNSYDVLYINQEKINTGTKSFKLSSKNRKKLAETIVSELYKYLEQVQILNLNIDDDIIHRTPENVTDYCIERLVEINETDFLPRRKVDLALEAIKERAIYEKVLDIRKNR